MKLIPLTQGKFTQVDDEDYEFLIQWKWTIRVTKNTSYAVRTNSTNNQIGMHRVLMHALKGEVIDHKDRDGLNNQKYNLRKCTHKQNLLNAVRKNTGTSIYKGVSWIKQHKKWKSDIQLNYKRVFLGYFDIEIDAAKAYDIKALELFGEFAYLNFK